MRRILHIGTGLATIFVLWTAAAFFFGESVVPWVPEVFRRLSENLGTVSLWTDLGLTFLRTLTGFFLAFVVGVPCGILMGRSRNADGFFFLPIILVQAAPPLLWVVPLILILGTDGQAPLAVVFLVVFPLVALNVRDARRSMAPTLADVFRIYAPSRRLVRREMLIPALSPALRSSLVLGLVLGLKSSVIGEWFGSHSGIGRTINQYYFVFDMGGFYALALVFLTLAALLGFAGEKAARTFFPARKPWAGSGKKNPPRSPAPLPPAPPPAGLQLSNIRFDWGHKTLFTNLDLDIAPGTVAVLSGPSGSGKTTLARLALKLLKPKAGHVVGPVRPAVLFQDDGLLNHRDALGNVLLPAWEQKLGGAETRALEYLQVVGLAESVHKFPDELSGGMKKRLCLARALMQNPDFLVLDEPFQNLDESSRNQLWDLTFSVVRSRGLGALVITHYPRELEGRGAVFFHLDQTGRLGIENP